MPSLIPARPLVTTLALATTLATLATACAPRSPDASRSAAPAPAAAPAPSADALSASLEARWGIHLESFDLSAGGFLLAFRYRVLDPEKAHPLMDRRLTSYALDKKSGARLEVPRPGKLGELRSRSDAPKGQIHFILFSNPGRLVKSGDRVAVVAGPFRADDLVVDGGASL